MAPGLLTVGLPLAASASLAINGGYLLQHLGGATAVAVTPARPWQSVRALARSRIWLAGTVAGLLGSLMHIGALAAAPLTFVQAFSAAGLSVAVSVAARVTHAGLRRTELLAIAAIVAGLGALALRPVVGPVAHLAFGSWAVFAAVVLAAATGLATVRGARRAAALGLATGLLYGLSDAATKAFTNELGGGLLAAVVSPWPPIIVAACAAAFFAFQRALQIGPAVTVIALMTAAMNASAVAAGVGVFGDRLGASTGIALVHTGALLVIGAAAWSLARAHARLASVEEIESRGGGRGRRRRGTLVPCAPVLTRSSSISTGS